jgi:uncharacterized repeat protein (TIGR01451 family)
MVAGRVLPLLLVMACWSLIASAQLDPRERYGTFLGGGVAAERDLNCYPGCPDVTSPATTAADRVVVDISGNTYVVGHTNSRDFPTTSGAYRTTVNFFCGHSGTCNSEDTFVIKFNSSGQRVWATYLGISSNSILSSPWALGLDSSGNIVVTGLSFKDSCGFLPFIMKLNSTGTALVYNNRVGTLCSDEFELYGGAVDPSSRYVYLAGQADIGFLPTPGAANPGSGNEGFGAFRVIKIDTQQTTNNGIVYIAGMDDQPTGVAANSAGNAYVLGVDTRVMKFDLKGALLFSVNYLPSFASTPSCCGSAIVLTSTSDVIFTSQTQPQGAYPATSSFGQPASGSNSDTIVVRLNGSTGSRVYSSAIHDSTMSPLALARNSANEAFVTGAVNASSLRVNTYSNAPSSGAFLMRLNSTGTSLWLDSPFGGHTGNSIVVDSAWNAFVVGTSLKSESFPLTSNAFQSSFKGADSQAFLAKLIIAADLKVTATASPNPVAHGANLTYTLSVTNNGPDVSDGDTLTDVLPANTTFVSSSTSNGSCTHPAVGSGGTFKCTRSGTLLKAHSWGPVKLTVKVNATSGSTINDTVSVATKTQDVVPANNTVIVSARVQ